jgi:DNA-binding FadR family transcriptional regulator
LGLYLAAIGCGSADIERNGTLLLQEFSGDQPRAGKFVRKLIAQTRESASLTPESALAPDRSASNRAIRISYRILRDLNETDMLLTIPDMMDRYHAGRPVLVQALRALESVELIRIIRGRSGGAVKCRPTAGTMVRMVLPAFLASGLRQDELAAILAAANVRCAVGACRMAERTVALGKLAAALDASAIARGDLAAQVRILRKIASCSGDELAHLFARTVWYCLARQTSGIYPCDPPSARLMVEVTRNLVDAVASGDSKSAARAARQFHRALDEVIYKAIVAQPEGPPAPAGPAIDESAVAAAI